MGTLTQFLFRLSFGLAAAMAATSPREVTSGYFRNHSYVLLGLNVLASLVAIGAPEQFHRWPPIVAAVTAYFAAVAWLYEAPRAGRWLLTVVAGVALVGAWLALGVNIGIETTASALRWLEPITSGLVLGVTIAAMFLGHWYLNTPTMRIQPLRRLVIAMAVAIGVRMLVCGVGLAHEFPLHSTTDYAWLSLVALRWLAGLVGTLVVAWMTWQTLKIPNTQSATGILYVGVIGVFLGELASMLLSSESVYPL